MDAVHLINRLGVRRIADELGMKSESVRMWRFRRTIPRSAWPELVRAFPEITLDELFAAHPPRERVAA